MRYVMGLILTSFSTALFATGEIHRFGLRFEEHTDQGTRVCELRSLYGDDKRATVEKSHLPARGGSLTSFETDRTEKEWLDLILEAQKSRLEPVSQAEGLSITISASYATQRHYRASDTDPVTRVVIFQSGPWEDFQNKSAAAHELINLAYSACVRAK